MTKSKLLKLTNNSLLCIGLDTDYSQLPKRFLKNKYPQFSFNQWIIDQTFDLVNSYKPNSAFYEARGADGIFELKMTCDYIKKHCPNISIILDAKRGDIGNSNNGYIQFAYDYLNADAITLHPYLGYDSLVPFLERKDKLNFILCKTSNPGSGEFQTLLFEKVARNVANTWNSQKNCGLVVGATYPSELKRVRTIVGNMPILVPGIGAQGGDLKKTLKEGLTKDKKGLIIAISRSILFAKNPRNEARKLQDEIYTFLSV